MIKLNDQFTKGLGQVLTGAKVLYDFGIEKKFTTPEAMRLTVQARQATARAMVKSGMSRRAVAKALGVSHPTILKDVGGKKVTTRGKKATASKQKSDDRSEEEKVIENLDTSDEGNVVRAFLFQLTGAAIAIQNCEKMLPMIAEMKSPPHADDWKELLTCTQQRTEEINGLLKRLRALDHPTTRRKKSILSEEMEETT